MVIYSEIIPQMLDGFSIQSNADLIAYQVQFRSSSAIFKEYNYVPFSLILWLGDLETQHSSTVYFEMNKLRYTNCLTFERDSKIDDSWLSEDTIKMSSNQEQHVAATYQPYSGREEITDFKNCIKKLSQGSDISESMSKSN